MKVLERPTLASVTSKSKALPNRLLLHAMQKWGKTSFAAMSPAPIFLCTRGEDGLDTLIKSGQLPETPHFPNTMPSWRHILMAIDELLVNDHPYKTFVMDTLNGAERLAIEHVIHESYDDKQDNYDAFGRGTKLLVPEIIKLLELLDRLRAQKGMGIIILAHSQVKTFNNPEGPNYDRWEPVLEKQVWAMVDRWVDMILFGNFETHLEKANKKDTKAKASGGQDRVIHTERHAAFDAGNRYGLPPEIECGDTPKEAWEAFIAALHPGRSKK